MQCNIKHYKYNATIVPIDVLPDKAADNFRLRMYYIAYK